MNFVTASGIGVIVVGALSLIIGITHSNFTNRLLFFLTCLGLAATFHFQYLTYLPPEVLLNLSLIHI